MARPKSRWRGLLVLGLTLVVLGGFGFHIGMTEGLDKPEERQSWSVIAVKAVLGNGELFQAYVFASYVDALSGLVLATAGGLNSFLDRLLKPHEPVRPPGIPTQPDSTIKD